MKRTPLVRLSAFLAILFLLLPGSLQAQGPMPGAPTQLPEPAGPPAPPNVSATDPGPSPAAGSVLNSSVDWPGEEMEVSRSFEQMTDRSLALDAEGHPHVAYGGSHLFYAEFDGSEWHSSTVDSSDNTGAHASLVLDSAGRPHISYVSRGSWSASVKYACYDGAAWQITNVATGLSLESYPTSLALDADGHPATSYYVYNESEDSGYLYYAEWDGSAWTLSLVEAGFPHQLSGQYSSLAIDSAGRPHIAYHVYHADTVEGELRYAYREGGTWHIEMIQQGTPWNPVGSYPSLALDSAEQPHISYSGTYQGKLLYAYISGTVWITETVDAGGSLLNSVGSSLVLDSADRPYIGYEKRWSGVVRYAYRNGTSWAIETVDEVNLAGNGGYTSLARSADGRPHLSYYDVGTGYFKYATLSDSTWLTTVLDRAGDFGQASALAVDANGQSHLSFCRIGAGQECAEIIYATLQGDMWQMQTVETNLGRQVDALSLALDADNQPHLAYHTHDPANNSGGLYYAHLSGTVWIKDTIEEVSIPLRNVGQYASLALKPDGRPCISYYNYDLANQNSGLHYACSDGSAWTIQTVESSAATGLYTSLALDGAGQAHVGYYDADTKDLRYAFYDGVSWMTETVDAVGDVGRYASLRLDSTGQPHISYRDGDSGALKYAYKSGTGWSIEIVDSDRSTCGQTSLLLDGADRPQIVYMMDWARLGYTYYDGGSWPREIIAALPSPIVTVSLAIDPAGRPHVSYIGDDHPVVHYAYRLDPVDGERWTIETAVMGRLAGEASTRSMAVDAAGNPHIAYGGNRLYYLSYDGTGWQREIADPSPGVGAGASLALDAAGRPHISYSAYGGGMISYAYYDGSAWQITRINQMEQHEHPDCTSIALDSAGRPHIAYPTNTSYHGELGYSYWDGMTWHNESITSTGPSLTCPSLALDSQDHPHIVFTDPTYTESLRYASYDGASWTVEGVTATYYDSEPSHPALALDSQDHPHICYGNDTESAVMYAWFDGSAWQTETVDGIGWYDRIWPSLVIDSADRPHLVYQDGYSGALAYAYQGNPGNGPDATWITETVDADSALHMNLALALTPSGEPTVSYLNVDDNVVALSTHGSSGWNIQVADTLGLPESYPSLALDAAEKPHLGYFLNGKLQYAYREPSGWQYQPVATSSDLTSSSAEISLRLDSTGRPHIAYSSATYDGQSSIVGYSMLSGTTWISTTIERVSRYNSGHVALSLDAADQPHVAYYRSIYPTTSQVIYASLSGTLWITETVVDGPYVYRTGRPTLALDSSGYPHISYLGIEDALMYTFYDGSAWHTEQVDGQRGQEGGCNSLVLDALDRPHISYCLDDGGLLKYAHWDGQWRIEVVEAGTDFWGETSLAIDAAGHAHIAYYVDGVLKHAYYDGQRWHAQQVETEPYWGEHPSLALDTDGHPHIAYGEDLYGDLKHAYLGSYSCDPIQAAQITGPTALHTGETGLYSATYAPLTATQPVTLTWDSGTLGPTAAYSWTEPGAYTVGVVAANACSAAPASFRVDVCQPVEGAVIAGPAILLPGENGTFTATVAPPTATSPVTFTWSSGALGPTAAYSWTMPGAYTVTVTATNACGQATAEWGVEVQAAVYRVYLPLVLR